MGVGILRQVGQAACSPLSSGPHFFVQVEQKGRGSFGNALCLRRSEMFSVTTADATRQSSVAGEFDPYFQAFHTQMDQRAMCV